MAPLSDYVSSIRVGANLVLKTARKILPVGILLCFIGVNARWLWLFRRGQPLDIDEAGYLSYSLNDYYGLLDGGIFGWIRAIESPSPHGPLTTAVSSLFYWALGPRIFVGGFSVLLLAGAAAIAATYFLGKSLGSPRVGLISSLLVASCPVIVVYSRSYHFSIPVTVVTTAALLALLRSDRFLNLKWVQIFSDDDVRV